MRSKLWFLNLIKKPWFYQPAILSVLSLLLLIIWSPESKKSKNVNLDDYKGILDYYSIRNCPALDLAVKKFISIAIRDREKLKGGDEQAQKNFSNEMIQSSEYNELKKTSAENNECGAVSLSFLELINWDLEKDKNFFHEKLVELANTNNTRAIYEVCMGAFTSAESIKFCEVVFNHSDKEEFRKIKHWDLKGWSGYLLQGAYYNLKKIDELATFCKKSKGLRFEEGCYNYLEVLANEMVGGDESIKIYYIQVINFWENIYFNGRDFLAKSDQDSDDDFKKKAYRNLKDLYIKTGSVEKLIKHCAQSFINDDKFCYFDLYQIGEEALKNKDYKKAYYLFTKAADGRYWLAENELGDMYFYGIGVTKNDPAAIKWYEEALYDAKDLNNSMRANILNNLGVSYARLGDYMHAFECYQRGAELGMPLAQMNLAYMYFNGRGTLRNIKEAYAWISISVSQGLQETGRQRAAENFKFYLRSILLRENNGFDLDEAEELERRYFEKYVKHDLFI